MYSQIEWKSYPCRSSSTTAKISSRDPNLEVYSLLIIKKQSESVPSNALIVWIKKRSANSTKLNLSRDRSPKRGSNSNTTSKIPSWVHSCRHIRLKPQLLYHKRELICVQLSNKSKNHPREGWKRLIIMGKFLKRAYQWKGTWQIYPISWRIHSYCLHYQLHRGLVSHPDTIKGQSYLLQACSTLWMIRLIA